MYIRMYIHVYGLSVAKAVNIVCRLLLHIMRTLLLDYAWGWG